MFNDKILNNSEEVKEVLESPPTWIIKSGQGVIFLVLITIILITNFITYPDILKGSIIITTETPPVKIISPKKGSILRLNFREGDTVLRHDIVAELENSITEDGISYLKSILDKIESTLENKNELINFNDSSFVFSDIQLQYNTLKKQYLDFKLWESSQYDSFNLSIIDRKYLEYENLIEISTNQLFNSKLELENAYVKYVIDSTLFIDGVNSKLDFFKNESEYRQKQLSTENLEKVISQYRITLFELEEQKSNILYNRQLTEINFLNDISNSIHLIRSQIDEWANINQISTPIQGKLTYLSSLSHNKFVDTSEPIFAVIPNDDKIIGIIELSGNGIGKVQVDQKVRIKLDNYPYPEFGEVLGTINHISIMSNSTNYLIKVDLIKGLQTTQFKELIYTPEMTGSAEVITQNLSLFDRILFNIRKAFELNSETKS